MTDIIGCREADREQIRVGSAAELHFVDESGREREVSLSTPGDARNVAWSPAVRAKRPVPTGFPPPVMAISRACPGRMTSFPAARAVASPVPASEFTLVTTAGTATPASPLHGAGPIPALVDFVPGHHDRGAVLAGDGDTAARWPLRFQAAERRHQQMLRRYLWAIELVPGWDSSSAQ